jgi:hypothetical protein
VRGDQHEASGEAGSLGAFQEVTQEKRHPNKNGTANPRGAETAQSGQRRGHSHWTEGRIADADTDL